MNAKIFITRMILAGGLLGSSVDLMATPPTPPPPSVSPAVTMVYARQLVSSLAGRPLDAKEQALITKDGSAALPTLIKAWLAEPFFEQAFRGQVDNLVGTSGKRDSVDFNLPGNLASHIVNQKLPFSELLTADYCVDGKGKKIACDTGAPFAAGVIATRGFMMAHSGRFNLSRANSLMSAFACTEYPMNVVLQPMIPKEELIENFRVTTVDESAGGNIEFGNGAACYACHGQFSAHTQFFVKFDENGVYRAAADGIQSKTLEFGRSEKGTFSSHFVDPTRSADETGDMFGVKGANLAEGMKVLATSPTFMKCMVKHTVSHALNLDSETANGIGNDFQEAVVKTIAAKDPSVQAFYEAVLSHPDLLNAFAKGISAP